jgi:hypothetical protein
MLNVYLGYGEGMEYIGEFDTLREAVRDLRESWNEGEGPQCFLLLDDQGWAVASLMRHQEDEEIAITTYCDGGVERHRCHYVLDDQDRYVKTVVTRLNEDLEPEVNEAHEQARAALNERPWTTEEILAREG